MAREPPFRRAEPPGDGQWQGGARDVVDRKADILAVLRALQNDPGGTRGEAWGDFYLFIEQTVSRTVRRLLRGFGFDEGEGEVVVLEFIEALYVRDRRKLRSCKAKSERAFRAWLRTGATWFTLNWTRDQSRAESRQHRAGTRVTGQFGPDAASLKLAEAERRGPDARQIEACLREWQSVMRPRDFARLLVLMGRSTPERPISACTERRWIRQLLDRYPHLFDGDG